MIEFIGAMAIIAGMFLIAIWLDDKRHKVVLVFGLLWVALGLAVVFIPQKPQAEKPIYSSEWIDEETKCHFWNGNPVSCETVRYVGEL
jgi:uncharacterized membrane protein HdeD (DUF308 family)